MPVDPTNDTWRSAGPWSLGSRTTFDLAPFGEMIVLVPVGSCEQHGPHLPLDTDTRIAQALAIAVCDDTVEGSGRVVAPAVAIGASGEHAGFPGTLSIGTAVLTDVLIELARSALPGTGPRAGAVVFVNGHGGNRDALVDAVACLRAEGRPVGAWAPSWPGGDAHAGFVETSVLLHLAPDVVRAQRPRGATEPLDELLPRLRDGGVAAVADNGVLGDATDATAAQGRRIFETWVHDLDDRLRRAGW